MTKVPRVRPHGMIHKSHGSPVFSMLRVNRFDDLSRALSALLSAPPGCRM